MSENAVEQWSPDEHAALAQMADALARFGAAIEACAAQDIDLVTALQACGIAVPSWAAPMVNRALDVVPQSEAAPS